MPDEKLDELIGRYGASVLMCADKIEISSQDYEICQDERKQAMQAIIDYHDEKEADAYTLGYQNAKKRFIKMQGEAKDED